MKNAVFSRSVPVQTLSESKVGSTNVKDGRTKDNLVSNIGYWIARKKYLF